MIKGYFGKYYPTKREVLNGKYNELSKYDLKKLLLVRNNGSIEPMPTLKQLWEHEYERKRFHARNKA